MGHTKVKERVGRNDVEYGRFVPLRVCRMSRAGLSFVHLVKERVERNDVEYGRFVSLRVCSTSRAEWVTLKLRRE